MVAILSAVVSIFVFRFRSRAALELKLVALQHQLAVLRRQRPGRDAAYLWLSHDGWDRAQLLSLDRLLWVLLYRVWPQVIDAMVLVKPAHRRRLASQGLPVLLALAIASSGTTEDRTAT
jgi:hypothetical protein